MSDIISFTIEKHIAVIGTSGNGGKVTKELNFVKWGDNLPKYDLRAWSANHKKGYKGISLTLDEVKALKAALDGLEL